MIDEYMGTYIRDVSVGKIYRSEGLLMYKYKLTVESTIRSSFGYNNFCIQKFRLQKTAVQYKPFQLQQLQLDDLK